MTDRQTGELTGFPSIDKPWLKYYTEDAINGELPHMTMYEYAWENNKDYLGDVAIDYYGSKITYDQFFKNVDKAIKGISSLDINAGDIITIMSMHTPETIYLIYACNYLGVVANMVYMTLSEKEIVHTINHTESKAFFVFEPAVARVSEIGNAINIPIIVLPISDSMPIFLKVIYKVKNHDYSGFSNYKEFVLKGENAAKPQIYSDPQAVAVIVYTSGTTGEPKGVMLTNDEINAIVFQDVNGIIDFRRNLFFLFMLPPFIGFGLVHLHVGISAGWVMLLQIDLKPDRVAKTLFKNKTGCFCAGPAFLDAILKHGVSNLDNLEYFICGGGEISAEKENEVNVFLKKCNSKATYSNGYGMTEAASVLCTNCNMISKIGSLGIPFVKTIVKVVDTETGEELGYNKQGELWFSTPSLMTGYYKNDDATSKIIFYDSNGNRWLRSGDLGYVDADGFVFMSGRMKRIFYVRAGAGEICRLFPTHIEDILEKSAYVASSAVVVREDAERISIPIAYVSVTEKAQNVPKEKVVEELHLLSQKELPEHMQPEHIYIITEMPMTQSGKIDYRKLEEMAEKTVI